MINFIYLIFQPLFLIFLYFFIGDISSVLLLIFIGFDVSFFYLAIAKKQMFNSSIYINAFIFYLLTEFVCVGLSTFYYAILLTNGFSQLRFSAIHYGPTELLKGAQLVLFADYFMFLSYFTVDFIRQKKNNETNIHKFCVDQNFITKVVNFLPFIYGGVWILRLLPYTFVRSLGSVVVNLKFHGGNILQMFLLTSLLFGINRDKKKTYIFIVTIFCCDIIYYATRGSKTMIIMLFVPFIIFFLSYTKGEFKQFLKPKIVVPLFCIIYFFAMIVFPLNKDIREKRLNSDIEISGVGGMAYGYLLKSLPWTEEFDEVHHLPSSGFWRFFARSSAIGANTVALIFNETDPDMRIDFLETSFLMLIPRIIWPDKPLNMTGTEASILISGRDGNSLGFGMAGSLLLSGGFLTIIIVMVFNGIVMNIGWAYIEKDIFYNPVSILCAFTLIWGAMRLPESHDGGVNYFIRFLVFYLFLCYLSRLWLNSRKDEKLYFNSDVGKEFSIAVNNTSV